MRLRGRGYSLIELMIVVVIVAILGVIGVPSYRAYILRSQRTEAKDALVRLASNQERYYLQNNTYTSDLTRLGFSSTGETPTGLYTVSVVAGQLAFTATATPSPDSGMLADTECQSFTIDESGERAAAPDPRASCW